jgi:hypothetical protein
MNATPLEMLSNRLHTIMMAGFHIKALALIAQRLDEGELFESPPTCEAINEYQQGIVALAAAIERFATEITDAADFPITDTDLKTGL